MLGKRSRPAIGKIAGAIRSGFMDSGPSPRSPLDCKMQSPRGLKNYDQGGIGLAIVVALDKPTKGAAVLAKYAICGPFSARSSPIPVHPSTKGNKINNTCKFKGHHMMEMEGLDEEFTYVTCHGPNQSITTRVYYDGCQFGKISPNDSVFKISPSRLANNRFTSASNSESESESESGFLSSCYLCRKTLHGKDIYMYRGEKAFCSAECRQMQIGMDERKEQCRSEASISSSPCPYATRGQIFFSTEIVAV